MQITGKTKIIWAAIILFFVVCVTCAVYQRAGFERQAGSGLQKVVSRIKSAQSGDATNLERVGVERSIAHGFQNIVSKIKILQSGVLPDRQRSDDVPERLRSSAGAFNTDIYRINQEVKFERVSKKIFSGKLAEIQLMPVRQFGPLIFFILASISIFLLLDLYVSSCWSAAAALGAISILSVLLSIRFSPGQDEFFINLRHAYTLLHHGVYSINANSMVEATVDLIPLLSTAFLGMLGIDLVDAFIVVSLLGNIVVIVFSYLLVRRLNQSRPWALITAFLAGLYPNLLVLGASGFSAVLFSGWILAASYFFIFTERRGLGLALLSALTLLRLEGILFAAILMFYFYLLNPLPDVLRTGKWKPVIKRAFADGSLVLIPFALSLLVRRLVYGYAIPIPVSFKNSNFDSSFFATGLDNFTQMVLYYDLHLTAIAAGLLLAVNIAAWKNNSGLKAWRTDIGKLLALDLSVFLFILPYHISGGDWFPVTWNRYGLPFNLVLFLTFMVLLHGAFSTRTTRRAGKAGLLLCVLVLLAGYLKNIPYRDNYIRNRFAHVLHPSDGWRRVDRLAYLGQFLRVFLPADAVVSSPEEATIMYFSGREMLGLLGVSNPDMASMPFQSLTPGDVFYRRRGYASIFKSRPDVIALYEPVVAGDFSDSPDLAGRIRRTLQNDMFNGEKVDIAYYRVGSFAALRRMGYKHVSISYSDVLFSFFIGERIYGDFVKTLKANGFKHLGSDSIAYAVDPGLSGRYVPAVKEIMAGM